MPNFNSCTFAGHIGRDAEASFTPSGTAVLKFSIAVKSGYGDKAVTSWINVVKWKPADWMAGACVKGAAVLVSGELQIREYNKKDGSKGISVEVTAQSLVMLSEREAAQPVSRPRTAAPQARRQQEQFDPNFIDEQDIPF